jgi:hypothetical protein
LEKQMTMGSRVILVPLMLRNRTLAEKKPHGTATYDVGLLSLLIPSFRMKHSKVDGELLLWKPQVIGFLYNPFQASFPRTVLVTGHRGQIQIE